MFHRRAGVHVVDFHSFQAPLHCDCLARALRFQCSVRAIATHHHFASGLKSISRPAKDKGLHAPLWGELGSSAVAGGAAGAVALVRRARRRRTQPAIQGREFVLAERGDAVARQQQLVGAGFELGDQLGRCATPRSRTRAARRRAPAGSGRREHLAAAGVEHRDDGRPVCRSGYATRSRLGTPTIGMRSACAITLAVVTPTRSPVNRPGPVPTAIARELTERHVELTAQVLDRGRELLGVTPPAGELTPRRAPRRRRRSRPTPAWSRCPSRAPARQPVPVAGVDECGERVAAPAHDDPRSAMTRRSSSPSPGVSSTSSRSTGRSAR